MCLSIAIAQPANVLARGSHERFDFIVTHNGRGYHCGYVRVSPDHPWYGKGWSDLDDEIEVHGGVTFAEADVACCEGGADDGWWIGFDAAHTGDLPDPSLPGANRGRYADLPGGSLFQDAYGGFLDMIDDLCSKPRSIEPGIRTQEYMEQQCRSLCEQARDVARAALAAP